MLAYHGKKKKKEVTCGGGLASSDFRDTVVLLESSLLSFFVYFLLCISGRVKRTKKKKKKDARCRDLLVLLVKKRWVPQFEDVVKRERKSKTQKWNGKQKRRRAHWDVPFRRKWKKGKTKRAQRISQSDDSLFFTLSQLSFYFRLLRQTSCLNLEVCRWRKARGKESVKNKNDKKRQRRDHVCSFPHSPKHAHTQSADIVATKARRWRVPRQRSAATSADDNNFCRRTHTKERKERWTDKK